MQTEAISGTRDMAQRWHNADQAGAQTLAQLGGLSASDGRKAWQVFVHIGLARADVVMGQPEFRHGATLEPDVIRRAVDQAAELLATRAAPWRKRRGR